MCVISRDHLSESDFSGHSVGRVIYQTAGGWQVVNGNFLGFARVARSDAQLRLFEEP